jgi:DNA-binding IclR family transcriptional regulator
VSPSVRAVERSLDILLCFTREEPIRSLGQIAESVHLSKPTAHRLLGTLEKKRFVIRDKVKGRYRLGVRLGLDSDQYLSEDGKSHQDKMVRETEAGFSPSSISIPR